MGVLRGTGTPGSTGAPLGRPAGGRCRANGRQVFSSHAVALSLPEPLPAHPGPHGGGVGGAVPADLPADGGGHRADGVPVLRGHPAADPEHAGGGRVRGGRAADRHPDLRRRSERHGGGGGARHRALPARVHRHQLRLPGQEGGAAERRLRLPARPGPGGPDHPGGHRRHPPAGHGQDPERLERRAAGPGRDRAADAGRRRPRVHPPRPDPDPDVLRQGRLGRDRAGGRGARHPGHRQRRRPDRRGHRAHAGSHRLRGDHGRPGRLRQSVALPGRARRCSRASRAGRRRRAPSGSRWPWSTPGWRFACRATPGRR